MRSRRGEAILAVVCLLAIAAMAVPGAAAGDSGRQNVAGTGPSAADVASSAANATSRTANATATATVTAGDAAVTVGDRTLVPIRLSSAPRGLSGYQLTASVTDGSVATVVGGEYPRTFNVTVDPKVSDSSVTLEAVDSQGEIQSGSSSVLLGYVAVKGASPGQTSVRISVSDMDDDEGNDVSPGVTSGTLNVDTRASGGGDGGGAAGGGGDGAAGGEDAAAKGGDDAGGGAATPTPVTVHTADGIVTPQVSGDDGSNSSDGAGGPPSSGGPAKSGLPVAPLLGVAVVIVAFAAVGVRRVIK